MNKYLYTQEYPMKKWPVFISQLFFILFLLSACSMNFLDNNDGGGSSEPQGYEVFDAETNTNYYYDGYDTLISYTRHDFDSSGRTVYSEEYTALDGFLGRNVYIWDVDNLIINASYGVTGNLLSFQYNVYDSNNLLIESGEYDAAGIFETASIYQFDGSGNMEFSAQIENAVTSIKATSGVEYAYDLDGRLIRKNLFKAQALGEHYSLPSLNVDSATPAIPSVSKPLIKSFGAYNTELTSYRTAFETSFDPAIILDSDFSSLTPINEDIPTLLASDTNRIWDSYWYYDDVSGADAYTGLTFTAETVPVVDDANNYYYTWLDQASTAFSDLYSEGIPENMNLPVQLYLDGGQGLNIDGTEVALDYPLRMELDYVPGLHSIRSKKVWYGSHKVLQMDVSYYDSGLTSQIALKGEAFIIPLSFNIQYLEGTSAPEILQLATGDITLQTLKYDFGGSANLAQDLVDTDFLDSVHTLWWYDENYDNSAEDSVNNENALVGRFVFNYVHADQLLTLNVFDDVDSASSSDAGFTGSYEIGYNLEDLRSSFRSYDAAGNMLMEYTYSYEELLEQAEGAANDALIAYNELQQSDLFGEYLPGTPSLPEIPYYLTEGFDAESMLDFLMNELEVFLPGNIEEILP